METERPELPDRREETLDPEDWEAMRILGHRMVDDVIRYHRDVRERPAWQPIPESSRAALANAPLPREGTGAEAAYHAFVEHVLPHPYGNIHPRHWGWVNGTGSTLGAFAEMLAAAMNPNCWGGHHAAPLLEERVLGWFKELMGFPSSASGILLSGGSEANLVGLAAARDAMAPGDVARTGVRTLPEGLVMYASTETHNSVRKAASLLGLGSDAVRAVPVDSGFRMDVPALRTLLSEDRNRGLRPVCIAATAGTVNTGAVDPLETLATLAAEESLWLHVDGAFGAVAALSPRLRPLLAGMERADSLAFDLHKWLHVPIEGAVALVREPADHRRPFASGASYLARMERGIASGDLFFSDLGPQLTRGFRAAKVWLTFLAHGTDVYGRLAEQNVRQARRLESLVAGDAGFELLAPVPLNVVCFRCAPPGLDAEALDALNRELLMRLQESGIAAPSGTSVHGRFGLRCAFTNHRTRTDDVDVLLRACRRIADEIRRAGG